MKQASRNKVDSVDLKASTGEIPALLETNRLIWVKFQGTGKQRSLSSYLNLPDWYRQPLTKAIRKVSAM